MVSTATLEDYLEAIGPGFQCCWSPSGTWIRGHGDGKSASGGKFHSETMTSTTSPVQYKIRVKEKKIVKKKMKEVVAYEHSWSSKPSDAQVVEDLQNAAKRLVKRQEVVDNAVLQTDDKGKEVLGDSPVTRSKGVVGNKRDLDGQQEDDENEVSSGDGVTPDMATMEVDEPPTGQRSSKRISGKKPGPW